MSRETEKLLKELNRFISLHKNEITDEDSMNRLYEQFLEEHDLNTPDLKNTASETADDYLELADRAMSKKNAWNICARRWSWNRRMWTCSFS